jgi:hypothetical protein
MFVHSVKTSDPDESGMILHNAKSPMICQALLNREMLKFNFGVLAKDDENDRLK